MTNLTTCKRCHADRLAWVQGSKGWYLAKTTVVHGVYTINGPTGGGVQVLPNQRHNCAEHLARINEVQRSIDTQAAETDRIRSAAARIAELGDSIIGHAAVVIANGQRYDSTVIGASDGLIDLSVPWGSGSVTRDAEDYGTRWELS